MTEKKEATMSGKAKIEGLTNSWYGFAVFSAIFSIVTNGIGIFSIATAVGSMVFSWIITFFIGRALVKKSGLTRTLLILISGLFSLVGSVAAVRTSYSFVQTWQFGLLFTVFYSAVSTWMNARSFRTLMDSSVKTYIAS